MRCGVGLLALVTMLSVARVAAQVTANPHGAEVGDCAACHLPNAWRPARVSKDFRHAERSFPLDGAHALTTCTACHPSLKFSDAPTRCSACHQDVHRGELGIDCGRCHTTRAFLDQARLVQRHEATRFPLRGMHISVPCESCHPSTQPGQAQYLGRSAMCVSCHRTEYANTTAPNHAAVGYATDCAGCHGFAAVTWQGAVFNHSVTRLPLTGAHLALACPACHRNGVFRGTPSDCVACHQADYSGTTNPNHTAAVFPTACQTCHTTASWAGASFNHDGPFFPIYSGSHRNRWTACSDCHLSSSSYSAFSCTTGCHPKAATDSHHQGRSGYQYVSSACYSCHPRGSAG